MRLGIEEEVMGVVCWWGFREGEGGEEFELGGKDWVRTVARNGAKISSFCSYVMLMLFLLYWRSMNSNAVSSSSRRI